MQNYDVGIDKRPLGGDMKKSFEAGDHVRLVHPQDDAEREARYVISEWNGDRGFIRLVCEMAIPPVELVREVDIEVVARDAG
jgi:hypothetical protein